MNKKIKSTSDEFIESLSPEELASFKVGYKEFALSELILALMENDEVSVRKLAKIAEISPTVIQDDEIRCKKRFYYAKFF